MSYRTSIDGVQIFGNNDYFPEWADFIKANGIEIDEDGCYFGYLYDVKGLFEVIDSITRKLIAEQHENVEKGLKNYVTGEPYREMTDLSDSMWFNEKTPLLMFNMRMVNDTYLFLPYQVYLILKDKIEHTDSYESNGIEWFLCAYKLKEGEKIEVRAG